MSNYTDYLDESLSKLRTVLDDSGSRPILFIGSGLSRRYLNAPDWIGLLEKLIELNPKKRFPIGYYTQQTGNNLPHVASAIVEEYQEYAWENCDKEMEIFPKFLFEQTFPKSIFLKHTVASIFDNLTNQFVIEGHQYEQELNALKTLHPHAIITTNYDCLLERLFPNHNVVIGQQVIKKKDAINIGHILKIHGCVTKPDEIVISHEDYTFFHEKQKYLIAKLLTYFMEHPVIFLGYSISDSNIKGILAEISEMVNGDGDEVVNNIWVIEWKKDEIAPDYKPPTDKTVDLGNGKSIRVNYLQINTFERLYESLYQHSAASLDDLRELQSNVYNIVKSKTITRLEVDMIKIRSFIDESALARLIGFREPEEAELVPQATMALLGVGTIVDAEQLMTIYPMRISQIAERLGVTNWYYVDQLIKRVTIETGFNLKDSNNKYHINVGIGQCEHRYSLDAVDLFKRVLDNEEYSVIIDNGQEVKSPNKTLG